MYNKLYPTQLGTRKLSWRSEDDGFRCSKHALDRYEPLEEDTEEIKENLNSAHSNPATK